MLAWIATALKDLTPTHWISIGALGVSLTSLTVSLLNYRRDRPKLLVTACLLAADEHPSYIAVKAVNAGRRPMLLVQVAGSDGSPAFYSWDINHPKEGIKLEEHEFHTFRITHLPRGQNQFYASTMDDDGYIEFTRFWIVDSLGERHQIPNIQELLSVLGAEYKEWCERTGYWKPRPTEASS